MTYFRRVGNKYLPGGRNLAWNAAAIPAVCGFAAAATVMVIPYGAVALPAYLLMLEDEGYDDCPKWLKYPLIAILVPGDALLATAQYAGKLASRSGWHRLWATVTTFAWMYLIFAGSFTLKFSPEHQLPASGAVQWFAFGCVMAGMPVAVAFMCYLIDVERENAAPSDL